MVLHPPKRDDVDMVGLTIAFKETAYLLLLRHWLSSSTLWISWFHH